jgi:arylsulfatase A-like enzyme
MYLPIAGHHPYSHNSNGPFSEAEEIGRYRNALHEGDAALGDLLNGLRQRGLDDSTMIIVLGDHGEAFGQHPGNYGHSLALYEENIRVPLLIALPGGALAGERIERTASLLDLAPTVLDLLGLTAPSAFDGESLLHPQRRTALFLADYSRGLLGLRDGCAKFIYELEGGRSKLFDLCADPGEQHNLAGQKTKQARTYRSRLLDWSAAQVARVERAH